MKNVRSATMNQIINSEVVVRTEGEVCNQCHFLGTTYSDRINYMPPLGVKITPNTLIDARGTSVVGATYNPPSRTWTGDVNQSWIVFFMNPHNQ